LINFHVNQLHVTEKINQKLVESLSEITVSHVNFIAGYSFAVIYDLHYCSMQKQTPSDNMS